MSVAVLFLVGSAIFRSPIDSDGARPRVSDTVTVEALKTAKTPGACLSLVGELFTKDMRSAKRAVANDNYRSNSATCGQRFDPMTVDTADLQTATILYLDGHLDRQLFTALDRPINAAPTDSARSEAILRAQSILMGSHDYDETPSWMAAEDDYVARLERVPHVRAVDLVKAHVQASWTYLPGDSHWQQHVDAAAGAVRSLTSSQRRTPAGREAVCALDEVRARGAAHADDYRGAVALLDHCLDLWPPARTKKGAHADDWQVGVRKKERREYALVGQRVPAALDAPHWLNAPATMKGADLSQPVTLVEFTWTGCPECHKGYPALRRINERYRDRGVDLTFMTYLFGSTPQHDTATAAQELDYDNRFWRDDKPIPFPIGVLAHPATEAYPDLFNTYAVIGAPTYYIIDRHGVIRFVQSGHSKDLEARLTGVIDQLLAEGATG